MYVCVGGVLNEESTGECTQQQAGQEGTGNSVVCQPNPLSCRKRRRLQRPAPDGCHPMNKSAVTCETLHWCLRLELGRWSASGWLSRRALPTAHAFIVCLLLPPLPPFPAPCQDPSCDFSGVCCCGTRNGNTVTLYRCRPGLTSFPFACAVGPHWPCVFATLACMVVPTVCVMFFL